VVTSSQVRVGVSDIAVSWEWLGVFGGVRGRGRATGGDTVADELRIALGDSESVGADGQPR
jgi:hypothetical protein